MQCYGTSEAAGAENKSTARRFACHPPSRAAANRVTQPNQRRTWCCVGQAWGPVKFSNPAIVALRRSIQR
jgi:hypothetical protein